jgi:hypothetical protein
MASIPYQYVPAAALAEMFLGMQYRVRVTLGQVQGTVERLLAGTMTGEDAAAEVLNRAGLPAGTTGEGSQPPLPPSDGSGGSGSGGENGSGGAGGGTASPSAQDDPQPQASQQQPQDGQQQQPQDGQQQQPQDGQQQQPQDGQQPQQQSVAGLATVRGQSQPDDRGVSPAAGAPPSGAPPSGAPPSGTTSGAPPSGASPSGAAAAVPPEDCAVVPGAVLPAPPSGSEKLLFSLEDIGERLREMGIGRLAIQPHRLVVRFSIRPGDSVGARYPLPVSPQRVQDQRRRGTQSMLARHSVQRTVLHLYTHFPTTVTPVLRTAMARLVTRLNNVIAHGVLELNESDGDVRYRTSIDYGECPDKAVVLAIFEQFVIGHRAIYAEYFDEVEACANGQGG